MGERRKRSRSRSRSRSRGRDRRRSRSRDRSDRKYYAPQYADTGIAAQMQQQQMAALQQQQLHQQLLAQQLLTIPQAATGVVGNETAAQMLDKKQREVYVGNLAIGSINGDLLSEFFNQALAHMVPNPATAPPCININMDGQGRFAFVELRTRELADFALTMDKVVEVCGRVLHVGRPKGWVEPTGPPLPQVSVGEGPGVGGPSIEGDQPGGPPPGPPPTRALLLYNVLPISALRDEQDRKELEEEVFEEAGCHGKIEAVTVPAPLDSCQDQGPGRCYLLYASVDDAVKGKDIFDGRTLDDNPIRALHVDEQEFQRAKEGEWIERQNNVAGIPLPGLYTVTPLVSGMPGITALNPSLAALVQTNPGIAASMKVGIIPEEVPFEEGYIKLRGFPVHYTKREIVDFFKECGEVSDEDVKMVYSADGTSLGEAFIHFKGPRAKLRLALAKDRTAIPPSMTTAEVLTSMESDMQRRMLSGGKVV